MKNRTKNEKHKLALMVWIAIYPLTIILYYLMGDQLMPFPLPVRTLIVTAIAVPLMVYLLMPLLNKIFNR